MTDTQEKPSNPLLANLRIPGETFRLPSQGVFYTNGELDSSVKNGEVHVYPMTTIDEISFKTPDMLFTGAAVIQVFARCIPQIKDTKALLSKDVDYLLACLRLITYGPTMSLTYKHNCEKAEKHEYNVEIRPIIQRAKAIDPTTLASAFTVKLENGQVVKLKPATFGSMMDLSQSFDIAGAVPSLEDLQKGLISVIVDMIASVDGIEDKDMIREWLEKLPAGWTKQMTAAIEQVGEWGAKFSTEQVCPDCGEKINIEFSTNPVSFFL